jgi:hypothetical protein
VVVALSDTLTVTHMQNSIIISSLNFGRPHQRSRSHNTSSISSNQKTETKLDHNAMQFSQNSPTQVKLQN